LEAESTKEEEIEKMVKELEESRGKFLKETGREASGHEESMDPLRKALEGDDEYLRKLAMAAMEAVGGPMPDTSMGDLNTQGAYLEKLAEVALKGVAPPVPKRVEQKIDSKYLKSLIKGLDADTPEDRREIILKLGELGEAAVRPLINELENKSWRVRVGATLALSMIGYASVDPLIEALQNKDWDVRRRVAQALGWIGDVKAASALSLALDDENAHVRIGAADALAIIGDSNAKSVLEKYHDDKLF
jgi:HEAT repeat protein